jgi:hypothetical protein
MAVTKARTMSYSRASLMDLAKVVTKEQTAATQTV